jgi:PPOX class probable F420-dependent enzyme
MATDMSPTEVREFLDHGTRTAKLAVVRATGAPHVVPIWFVRDGDDLIFTTGADTVKGKAMMRDPRVALCVDDETPPYSFVMIEGNAELSADLDAMRLWATGIGCRYMGAENAEAFGRRNAVPEERLVRVRPTRVVGRANMTE